MGEIDKILDDVKSLRIQGATNVAYAVIDGISVFSNLYQGNSSEEFISELKTIAWKLASARSTEPLARNITRFIFSQVPADSSLPDLLENIIPSLVISSRKLLEEVETKIVRFGADLFTQKEKVDALYTHCHSGTAEEIIKEVHNKFQSLKVYASETRPLYQGRITATHLFKAGIDVTLIADSANAMFISSKKIPDIDSVIVGCDEIAGNGDFLNKIGTLDVALAAQYAKKPFYVATTLLKLDSQFDEGHTPIIEYRSADEIWPEAPAGLKMVNPAFDRIPASLVSGYITEAGVILPSEVDDAAVKEYAWFKQY